MISLYKEIDEFKEVPEMIGNLFGRYSPFKRSVFLKIFLSS
jgi:hypothetical protein